MRVDTLRPPYHLMYVARSMEATGRQGYRTVDITDPPPSTHI